MKKTFTGHVMIMILLLAGASATAQFNYQSANAVVLQGTYTDLGTCGTKIDKTFLNFPIEDYDDTVTLAYNIGFNFVYNGATYTKFVLSTNGFIRLGTTAPGAFNYDFLNSGDANIIAPFNIDLQGNIAPEFRVCVSGSSPNRICTIQFKDMRDIVGLSNQYQSISFQIKLYETSNRIEFIYGNFIPTTDAAAVIPAKAGIKGNNFDFSVNAAKKSFTLWAAAGFIDGRYITDNFNVRNNVLPAPGLTFRFNAVPLAANDAKVNYVYSKGELPLLLGFPDTVRAQIRNTGSQALNNLKVYLNVTGANTYSDSVTISSVAAGAFAQVAFRPYSCTVTGVNQVTVSLPADANNSNNSISLQQRVNEGLYSYADNDAILGNAGFENGAGILLCRYNMIGTGYVTGIRAYISGDTGNIGKTVFAAVLNTGGTILARSANVVLRQTDLNAYKYFPLITSAQFSNISFFAGLAQTASLNRYFPLGFQGEGVPARTGAYFTTDITGGQFSESNNLGRFMIQAIVNNLPLPESDGTLRICAGGTAFLTAGITGTTYQWQVNTGTAWVNISNNANYSGTTTDSLGLNNIPSTFYGYQYRCLVDSNLGSVYLIRISSTWTGAVNNNWENTGNWSCNSLPDENTDVFIPIEGSPVLNSIQSVRAVYTSPLVNLQIRSGARLNVRK